MNSKSNIGIQRAFLCAASLFLATFLIGTTSAYAAGGNVTISTASTSGGTWTSGAGLYTFTATSDNANIHVGDITTYLSTSNVQVSTGTPTGSIPGAINVTTSLSWSSHKLTLDAYTSISVSGTIPTPTTMAASSTAALVLTTNDGGTGGQLTFTHGNVTFASLSESLTINGLGYTLVNTLPTLISAIELNKSGDFAFAQSYNASGDGTYGSAPIPVAYPFSGILEGLGNGISYLTIDDTTANDPAALFAQVASGGAVNDVNLTYASVTGTAPNSSSSDSTAAALVATNYGTLSGDSSTGSNTITLQCEMAGCYVGTYGYLGGLVALNAGTILNSTANENVTSLANGTYAGGLVGYNYGSTSAPALIQNSTFSAGTVTASPGSGGDQAGGLVGQNNGGTIQNSNTSGTVACASTSGDTVGGLVGQNVNNSDVLGYILSSYSTATVGSTSDCDVAGGLVGANVSVIGVTSGGAPAVSYATGNVEEGSSGGWAGGLVGTNTGTIEYSFADGGAVEGHGFIGGLVGTNGGGESGPVASINQSFSTESVTDEGGLQLSLYSYGGLVGLNAQYGMIKDSYAKGSVKSTSSSCNPCNIGGFVGENETPHSGDPATNLEYAYEVGTVTAVSTACFGGFVGTNVATNGASVTAAYWDTDTSHQLYGWDSSCSGTDGGDGILGESDNDLMSAIPSPFALGVWTRDPAKNDSYPFLISNPPPS